MREEIQQLGVAMYARSKFFPFLFILFFLFGSCKESSPGQVDLTGELPGKYFVDIAGVNIHTEFSMIISKASNRMLKLDFDVITVKSGVEKREVFELTNVEVKALESFETKQVATVKYGDGSEEELRFQVTGSLSGRKLALSSQSWSIPEEKSRALYLIALRKEQ